MKKWLGDLQREIANAGFEIQWCVVQALRLWLKKKNNANKFYGALSKLSQSVAAYSTFVEQIDIEKLDIDERDIVDGIAQVDILHAYALMSLLSTYLVDNPSLEDSQSILLLSQSLSDALLYVDIKGE